VGTRDSALVLRARSFLPTLRWPTWPLAPSLESPGLLRPSPDRSGRSAEAASIPPRPSFALGHADPSITLRVYAHVISEQLAEAAVIFARAVGSD
jgi:hypothetical protein